MSKPQLVIVEALPQHGKCTVFGYGRVSTGKQNCSLQDQKEWVHDCFKASASIPDNNVTWGGWFSDPEISGKRNLFSRPAGSEILPLLRPGDVIIAMKQDRLFRSALDCHQSLDIVIKLGAGFITPEIRQIGDIRTPFGKAMLGILAVINELERDLISERTKLGFNFRKEHGLPWNQAPIGWLIRKTEGQRYYAPDIPARRIADYFLTLNDIYGASHATIAAKANREGIKNPRIYRKTQDSKRSFSKRVVEKFVNAARRNYPFANKDFVPAKPGEVRRLGRRLNSEASR